MLSGPLVVKSLPLEVISYYRVLRIAEPVEVMVGRSRQGGTVLPGIQYSGVALSLLGVFYLRCGQV